MIVLFIVLCVLLIAVFSILNRFYRHWKNIQEGVTVYRCDLDMNICSTYRVVILGKHKYLADTKHYTPHLKYDFLDYVKDVQTHRVLTEDQVDSFD